MTPARRAVVTDHFHGFGVGESDWFLDGFSTVGAPLRPLAPVPVIERPEAYRAARPAILGSRTSRSMERRGAFFLKRRFRVGVHDLMRLFTLFSPPVFNHFLNFFDLHLFKDFLDGTAFFRWNVIKGQPIFDFSMLVNVLSVSAAKKINH